MKDTEDIVRSIIGRFLNVESEDIGIKVELSSLGIDSLDAMAIALDIEKELGIDIPDDVAISREWTIADITEYIESNYK